MSNYVRLTTALMALCLLTPVSGLAQNSNSSWVGTYIGWDLSEIGNWNSPQTLKNSSCKLEIKQEADGTFNAELSRHLKLTDSYVRMYSTPLRQSGSSLYGGEPGFGNRTLYVDLNIDNAISAADLKIQSIGGFFSMPQFSVEMVSLFTCSSLIKVADLEKLEKESSEGN